MDRYVSVSVVEEIIWEILNNMGISQKHNWDLVEEVQATIDSYIENDDVPEPSDDELEMGFDPYMGCYTEDC